MLKGRTESSSPCADSLLPLKSAKYFGPDLNRTDGASSVKNGQLYIAVRRKEWEEPKDTDKTARKETKGSRLLCVLAACWLSHG